MIPLPIFSQRLYVIAAISAVSALLAGVLLYQVATPLAHAIGLETTKSPSSETVYLSGAAATAASTPGETPILEVHIANNGLTLLRGARVLSISGSNIRVGMTWGSSNFSWMVQADHATKFLNAKGEKETAANIHIGDIVTVTGTIVRSGAEPTVNADVVRK